MERNDALYQAYCAILREELVPATGCTEPIALAYCAAKAGMDHFTRCLALDEARKPHGARVCSLAPGVIDTDMQTQLRSANAAQFPDAHNFAQLKAGGQLTSPADAAVRVLAWLERRDFGNPPVADVRDAQV